MNSKMVFPDNKNFMAYDLQHNMFINHSAKTGDQTTVKATSWVGILVT
jgi:hypothetical protein